jgi:hypothetical protein
VDPQLGDCRQLADGDEGLVGLVQQVDYLGQVESVSQCKVYSPSCGPTAEGS